MNRGKQLIQAWVVVQIVSIGMSLSAQIQSPTAGPQYQQMIPSTMPSTMESFGIPEMSNSTESLVTQTIDLEKTIASYAALERLSIQEARMETLLFLGMTPKTKAVQTSHSNPTFEFIKNDRYAVTAPTSFFAAFPSMQLSLELGKKQVVITCRMISIVPKQSKRINAFVTPGTAEVYCSKMPNVTPLATVKVGSLDEFNTDTFVASSTVVHKNIPVTTGTISKQNLSKLKNYLDHSKTKSRFAPTVVTFPGQLATISDTSKRPFVVGLEAVHDDDQFIGMQPVVQTIDDGITVRLKAIPRDNQIQLLADIAISEIGDVHIFTFANSGEKSQRSFQVPEHKLRQIHFSTLLDPDSAILIDPNYIQKTAKNGKRKRSEMKMLFIMQAHLADMK